MVRLNAKIMKFLFSCTGIILAIQTIYFYEMAIGWLHAPLFVLFLITVDLFKDEVRYFKLELYTLMVFSLLAILTILNKVYNLDLIFYLKALVFLVIVSNMYMVFKTFRVFVSHKAELFTNDRNIKLAGKKSVFMPVYCILVELVLLGAILQLCLKNTFL